MCLFHVQDADRPLYIRAKDYTEALDKWRAVIGEENELNEEERKTEQPQGICFVCDENDFIP